MYYFQVSIVALLLVAHTKSKFLSLASEKIHNLSQEALIGISSASFREKEEGNFRCLV